MDITLMELGGEVMKFVCKSLIFFYIYYSSSVIL